MAVVERRFRAMGSDCQVVAVAAASTAARAADDAERLVLDLEARWSRFLAGSELSRLNATGRAVVSTETFDVVSRAVAAWSATGGRFDPTVEPALAALGYDRSYERVGSEVVPSRPPAPAPGCQGARLDAARSAVRLPRGVRLDLGAIGKGRAADLVVERTHADGLCVNVGGDLRVRGESPDGGEWRVAVEAPDGTAHTHLLLADGAVATSSPAAKTWRAGGEPAHHVVDPRTGRSATTDVASATVVAGEGWWAEVLATTALLAGSRRAIADVSRLGGAALLHLADGTARTGVGLAPFLAAAS